MNEQNDVGGVDVEKVMAMVQEFGAAMNHIGAGIGEDHDRDVGVILAEIRALLASPVAAPVVGWIPDDMALVSRRLDNETWKRLIAADVWPVTPQSFQRLLDVLTAAPAIASQSEETK